MIYKARINHAVSAGVLTLVKGSWHNHAGPGRARTYRLHVPAASAEDEILDHDGAVALLTGEAAIGGSVKKTPPVDRVAFRAAEENDAEPVNRPASNSKIHPATLPEEGPDRRLGTGPRERDPQRDAPVRLPGVGPCTHRADHSRASDGPSHRFAFARDPVSRTSVRLIDEHAQHSSVGAVARRPP